MIEHDLFGTVRLVRHWGRVGTMQGRELAQDFTTEAEAVEARERHDGGQKAAGVPGPVRSVSAGRGLDPMTGEVLPGPLTNWSPGWLT